MEPVIASVDCGSSLIKAGIIDLTGKLISSASRDVPCILKSDGRVEIDPNLIVAGVFAALKEAVGASGISPAAVSALAVSSQRASVLCVDRKGDPIGNAVSWQDMRGGSEIDRFKSLIDDTEYYNITGIPDNPLFTLSKILFIKKNNPALYKKSSKFTLICDHIQRNFGCAESGVDFSNASLTGMLDISSLRWSDKIIGLADISKDKLPALTPSGVSIGSVSGRAASECGLLKGTPIISGAGDQQCALIGTGALRKGVYALTIGTASVLMGLSSSAFKDPGMKIFCTHSSLEGRWMLEGFQSSAGAGVNWLKRALLRGGRMSEKFLREVAGIKPGAEGVLFYPYFTGAAAPNWNPDASGLCLGLNLSHSAASVTRAVFEAIAMETRGICDLFAAAGEAAQEIRLSGGLANIKILNQIYSDVLNKKIVTLKNPESALLGAAILAASGAGLFGSVEEAAAKMVAAAKTYMPDPQNVRSYSKVFEKYKGIYESLQNNNIFKTIKS